MNKLVQDLILARESVQHLSGMLNKKITDIVLLLLKLNNPKFVDLEDADIWWWFGEEENRPFRRGDRHGYFRSRTDTIQIYLDEPHASIPGFDSNISATYTVSSEKIIPIKYLDMTDEEITSDAIAIMSKAIPNKITTEQIRDNIRMSAMAKLTDIEKSALGLK